MPPRTQAPRAPAQTNQKNAWVRHVLAYRSSHGCTFGEALTRARPTYRGCACALDDATEKGTSKGKKQAKKKGGAMARYRSFTPEQIEILSKISKGGKYSFEEFQKLEVSDARELKTKLERFQNLSAREIQKLNSSTSVHERTSIEQYTASELSEKLDTDPEPIYELIRNSSLAGRYHLQDGGFVVISPNIHTFILVYDASSNLRKRHIYETPHS